MQISFSPMRRDDRPELSVSGDVLTINGEEFDFSGVPDGATLPQEAVACDWLASDVERIGGVLHLTLILPHGADAPQEALFPEPLSVSEGSIPLPASHS
jgi:hypothetical protein